MGRLQINKSIGKQYYWLLSWPWPKTKLEAHGAHTVDGINYASVCHMGPKYSPRPQNGFFTKRAQNRALELSIGASGSKLHCASFLSWPCLGKSINFVDAVYLLCFADRNWLPIICFCHNLVPDATSGRNETSIRHRITRWIQWACFYIKKPIGK